jgi:hypothetical protein
VNGILTGAVSELPIVSRNNKENLGLVMIPLEDIGYAFSMLFGNLMIFEFLNKKLPEVYPHHNKIKQRIKNYELVKYKYF